MCRAHVDCSPGRSNRRCAGKGQVGAKYTSEKLAKGFGVEGDVPDYSVSYKTEQAALGQIDTTPEGVTEGTKTSRATDPIDPQDFDNFHRVVSKMINKSDMTEHDKRIARKQWNGAKKEADRGEVTYAKLAAWQRVMAGTALAIASKIPDDRGDQKVNWRQMNTVLNDRRPMEDVTFDNVVSAPGFDSREDFEREFPAVEDEPKASAPALASESVTAPESPVAKPEPRVSRQAVADDADDDTWTGSRRDDEFADSSYDNDDADDDNDDGFDLDAELASYDDLFKDSGKEPSELKDYDYDS